ncbi:paraquat-inducible protein A [Bythopirellula polymerisocia]|uniref:Paraquat-inducible protein A n=1 Tax=Bythopirellula polymerisocia TaxID=2528003 RepID=A0A5C6CJ38_9BACT|nr:paraquat-inducible protein A [Bythopirellula polymerisocia]TWU22799.1 Paraquat-inducible protein A [Bythopirellula polymerisocia]
MLPDLKACHCCGQIQLAPPLAPRQLAKCARCGSTVCRFGNHSASRTAALATAAFILYWPAILLPILEIEQLGRHHQTSLLMGTIDLLREGSWFVGMVVLLFSIVFPLVKIVLLLELSLLGILHQKHKAATYRIMEQAGKWSMLDVMLIAFMVMLVKLGSLVEFHFGPAVWAFVLCVAMSMWASLSFDPHSIWVDEHD